MVKFLYTVFIGLLLATSVGVGIAAFYESPKAPEYSNTYQSEKPTPEQLEEQKKFDAAVKEHEKKIEPYNRNVALIAVGFSIIILIVSLVWLKHIQVIADGLLLGGVFTLIYGIIRSFGSGEQKFMFAIVFFGLIVAITLGYLKFIKPAEAKK